MKNLLVNTWAVIQTVYWMYTDKEFDRRVREILRLRKEGFDTSHMVDVFEEWLLKRHPHAVKPY